MTDPATLSRSARLAGVLALGAFWGLSPALYKAMGQAGVPITHILAITGFGVGFGLIAIQAAVGQRLQLDRATLLYGLGCGVLLNVPFAFSLYFSRHLPVTVYAMVTATSPLMTFTLAALLGLERVTAARALALLLGLTSTIVLILTANGAELGGSASFIGLAFVTPMLYAFYNIFCQRAWPKGMEPLTAGIVESFASALLAVPFLFWLEPPRLAMTDAGFLTGYWTVALATLMWVLERVAFFQLIRGAGATTTVQAVYVSTPAGVLFGMLLYSEPPTIWLALSLGLLLAALWLNNRGKIAAL